MGNKGVGDDDDDDDANDILFVVAGTLTAHFAVNYVRHHSSIMHTHQNSNGEEKQGMPYKYVVSVASKAFNEACPPILRAMGRLTWASKQAVLAAGDTFFPPNEMLLLGYLEDMRIGVRTSFLLPFSSPAKILTL